MINKLFQTIEPECTNAEGTTVRQEPENGKVVVELKNITLELVPFNESGMKTINEGLAQMPVPEALDFAGTLAVHGAEANEFNFIIKDNKVSMMKFVENFKTPKVPLVAKVVNKFMTYYRESGINNGAYMKVPTPLQTIKEFITSF